MSSPSSNRIVRIITVFTIGKKLISVSVTTPREGEDKAQAERRRLKGDIKIVNRDLIGEKKETTGQRFERCASPDNTKK